MKSESEILERLEELDGSHIPREAGGTTAMTEIRTLLWVIDEEGKYSTDRHCVYVDDSVVNN